MADLPCLEQSGVYFGSEAAVTTTTNPAPSDDGAEGSSGSSLDIPTASSNAAAAATTTTTTTSAAGSGSSDDAWRWEESADAVLAYGALVGLLALGNVPALQGAKLADLPYFVGLAGILAPVLASVSLFGFYLLIKYLPNFNVQAFLNAYFWMLGSFAIGGAAVPVLRNVGGPLGELSIKFAVPEGWLLDEQGKSITQAELAPTDIAAVALALGLSTAELASGHTNFTLNNLIATLVATDILQLIGPRSFRTAGLLLTGLLLYDVFWVFGSPKVIGDNVMLTVATSQLVSGPTRILFPRLPGGGSTMEAAAASFPFSLLGLGDIAIPGLLACLALRYDATRSTDMRARAVAAADAIRSALAALEPGATSRQIADATADAAEAAYDRIADQEARQRTQSLDGTNAGGGVGDDGSAAAAAAASSLGASLARGVSAAASGGAGGSAALGGSRASFGTSASGRLNAALSAAADADPATPSSSGADGIALGAAEAPEQQPRLPVSEAVLYQRPYFSAVMVSYVVGLAAAFVANDVTGLGQPALLYIVPATLGSVIFTALQRGELGRIWSFTDVPSYGLPTKEGK
ncbi:PSL3 protein [Gonium pectorale]|uniref:PSL3 protein n=1 Tax=Gonium pectorale TaxID=33097 RepID=A0A150GP85_GONPE|nr:PSL3 protein [Gonium pectorale]|eukprot:KXZ51676.1 PSL3 protein [Gonium pectorale]